PDEPVMAALLSSDKEAFIKRDLDQRRLYAMPPFGRLAAVLVTGDSPSPVEGVARALARAFPKTPGVVLFGPAPAPLARLKGRFRYRLLLKGPRERALQPLIREWLAGVRIPSNVRVKADVDPYNFL
ncbi:MAG TPA: primosomal protein N', partial [Sphingomonadales bacterium]|nr:primosomal protein N' [Sphingomonadales bacterium]